jgi:hypothetical protein
MVRPSFPKFRDLGDALICAPLKFGIFPREWHKKLQVPLENNCESRAASSIQPLFYRQDWSYGVDIYGIL